jgi:dTDP-4-dehydrorhamnose 3,5-epimerase
MESWNAARFAEAGMAADWVQDNHARSVRNTLRGLHFQRGRGQAKLIRCVRGAVWDVALDIRPASPTFGQWYGCELSDENHLQLFIPAGFAHGYAVLSDLADVLYKCDRLYDAALEDGIRWNDADLAVAWPVREPLLSARDQTSQTFAEFCAALDR